MGFTELIHIIANLPIQIIIFVLFLIGIIAYIGYSLSSKEPDLKSGLNHRQIWGVLITTSLFIGISYLIYYFSQSMFLMLLAIFLTIVEIISIVYWFYDPSLYVLSEIKLLIERNFKSNGNQEDALKYNKFAIVICAYNEEQVLGNLLSAINNLDYNKEYYDTYVVCDNCIDGTEEIVDSFDANKIIRHDKTKIGKGFALEYFFNSLKNDFNKEKYYDAYVVIDADNLLNQEFLTKINSRLNNGEEVIQAYLGCKNPKGTWVSCSYSLAYWITNDIFQKAHHNLNLSSQLGGTGMIIKRSILEEIGLPGDSLTEDVLFTTKYVLKKNKPCTWSDEAEILDEKPLQLGNSIKQRTRWMQGHINTCFKYFLPLIKNSVKYRSFRQFDAAFYLIKPIFNLFLFFGYIISISKTIFLPNLFTPLPEFASWEFLVILLLFHLILYSFILVRAGKYKYILGIPLLLIYSLTFYIAIFKGLIKRNEHYWVKTEHSCAVDVDEKSF